MFSSALYHQTPQKKSAPARNSKLFFQPKLTINQPNDVYEQEADAMAEKVMRIPANENTFFKSVAKLAQRKCSNCKEEENLQMKEQNNAGNEIIAPPVVHDAVTSPG